MGNLQVKPESSARPKRRSERGLNTRRRVVCVYVTDEEKALLEAASANMGISMARVLLDAALHRPELPAHKHAEGLNLVSEMRHYRRQLEGIAVNMNQVAFHANSRHEVPLEFEAALRQVYSLVDELNDVLAKVRRR